MGTMASLFTSNGTASCRSKRGRTRVARTKGATPAAIETAFRRWMQLNDVLVASLAVSHGSTLKGSWGYGGRKPSDPARIAGLFKAVTGLCVSRLVDAGYMSFGACASVLLS